MVINLKMKNKFVDAQGMRIENPDTFQAHSKEDLDSLKPNDFVKVSDIDGVHPLPDQYKILGEAVAKKVKSMKI